MKGRKPAYRSVFEDWYRVYWPRRTAPYIQCFYCGIPADTQDHQPPISKFQEYRDLCLEHGFFVKVPCCRECNSLLGDTPTESLIDRDMLAKNLLMNRYRKTLEVGDWDAEEIMELGANLRSTVLKGYRQAQFVEERLDWSHGINSWVEDIEFHEEKRAGELG